MIFNKSVSVEGFFQKKILVAFEESEEKKISVLNLPKKGFCIEKVKSGSVYSLVLKGVEESVGVSLASFTEEALADEALQQIKKALKGGIFKKLGKGVVWLFVFLVLFANLRAQVSPGPAPASGIPYTPGMVPSMSSLNGLELPPGMTLPPGFNLDNGSALPAPSRETESLEGGEASPIDEVAQRNGMSQQELRAEVERRVREIANRAGVSLPDNIDAIVDAELSKAAGQKVVTPPPVSSAPSNSVVDSLKSFK